MSWLHILRVDDQGYVDTGGVYYGPYDSLTLLWQGERLAVVHCKGHTQYWGQSAHYIPAHVMAFEKMETDEQGDWLVRKVNEVDTGRASKRVKADMIAWAKEKEEALEEEETENLDIRFASTNRSEDVDAAFKKGRD